MSPRALWIPFEVEDLEEATRFFTDDVGLSVVDGWEAERERGVVLRVADGAFIELVSPGVGHHRPLIAFEEATESEVDSAHERFAGASPEPHRHPRGHYGFIVDGPVGARVMVWSENDHA